MVVVLGGWGEVWEKIVNIGDGVVHGERDVEGSWRMVRFGVGVYGRNEWNMVYYEIAGHFEI